MPQEVTIALDVMSGDRGIEAVIPAVEQTLSRHNHVRFLLVGDEKAIDAKLSSGVDQDRRIEIIHASQVVTMEDSPVQALRGKRDSSMRVAINCVKDGHAEACVSAGNTGALMATARYVLKTLSGIDRPAIGTAIPAIQGHTQMLDLGANIDSTAEQLYQFAVMGSVLASALDGIEHPRIGLLNIGEESIKGGEVIQKAAQLLKSSNLNYHGFVEGDSMFFDTVDVIVCDGFAGNVSLKSSEGVATLIGHYIRQEFKRNWLSKLAALCAAPVLKSFRKTIDPRQYNGASLLGLQGIVVKSHGGADHVSFQRAIEIALLGVANNIPWQIKNKLEQYLLSA